MAERKRAHKAELARIIGVSATVLTKYQHDPTFPQFDKSGEAEIYSVCVWHSDAKTAKPIAYDSDDMLVGTESEGLERYRMAKAQIEEIKLAEQRCQIVRMDDFQESIQAIMGPYRRLAENLKRLGQTELWAMVEEANAEVLSGLERFDGHADASGQGSVDGIRDEQQTGTG